jgi:GNAT superfamily N-acetyltransferase
MSSLESISIRFLKPADLPAAVDLSTFAGWNQTPDDWRMLLELEPEGCFGIEAEGRIVATTTLLCHARRLAWIGMVLTHPEFRRRGFARQLFACALERARLLGIQTVKLDATDEGRPLYESFGFRPEQPVERWIRQGPTVMESESANPLPSHFVSAIDIEACGYDRTKLLRSLSERGQTLFTKTAHLFCRSGRLRRYVGPCVAQESEMAVHLIRHAIESSSGAGWVWDLLPRNRYALKLAEDLGFVPQRVLTRMVLGTDLRGREEWIYAVAGFELG